MSKLEQDPSRRGFLTTASLCLLSALQSKPSLASDDKAAASMSEAPSLESVTDAMMLAAGYMQRACGPDGRFIHLVDIRTGEQSTSYNIVRHAGAIHALAMLQRQYPSAATHEATVRAAGYLHRLYLGPAAEPGLLVVWSKPLPDHRLTVLGASGLGLLALAEVRQQSPETVPLAELQALGRFLLTQQREDGSFASKYSLGEGLEDAFESLYYPGEAVLGLLALYEVDRAPEWLTAAVRGLTFLARSRRNLTRLPPDHWALIATTRLFSVCAKGTCTSPREELVYHAEQICTSILQENMLSLAQPKSTPAYRDPVRTTPVATRVEGLVAASTFLSDKKLCG